MSATAVALDRLEARDKVTGAAVYAYEHDVDGVAYAAIVQSTIACGEIRAIGATAAQAVPGVLAVLSHENAPRLAELDDRELAILQSRTVSYRGQPVAVVVARSFEVAGRAARLILVDYDERDHDVVVRADHPGLFKPDRVNPDFETDTREGDVEAALATAPVTVDEVYETPAVHNNPMEPHATLAEWDGDMVTVYDSTQGATDVRETLATAFGLEPDRVRVISPHVGGGFGSKGTPRPHVVLAVMAARTVRRPVKLAATRQQMFSFTGYRTPTIQRVRLGADRDGRLTAIVHEVVEQTSRLVEFAEQTAVVSRMLYAAPNRRTGHRLVALDVPTPSWMRAPGECPGMFALESAMDELALACGLDPVELRIRNEPDRDPDSGQPFSSRGLIACLNEGAERFGWDGRDPTPGVRRDGRWLTGTGVAASTYPARRRPSQASARREPGGGVVVGLAAADTGTGARTVLTEIAAETLGLPATAVRVELGDTALPPAPLAGGSMGTASWGSAVVKACRKLLESGADEVLVDTTEELEADEPFARHAFGAQFVEVRVDPDTGEVRVPRLLGVFAAGRIVNPNTARSQFIGGMTMGLGMALMEESILDPRFGDYVNHDLAGYPVPVCADALEIEASWIDEDDPHLNPMGTKGIGEIGIVGSAAAIANAVHHATGVRVRSLPIRLEKLVAAR
ncbi:MAG TPA: xanthine dehydrogenase family protein molybdopterin-binding subunit [Gaiellaceae bacterium]|nr:xanthine dehydrogenase family protein molybdopterin-binding subunit [Gaiellaceae bacterium]